MEFDIVVTDTIDEKTRVAILDPLVAYNGVHVIRLRWGKVVSIHAYLDTQVLIDTFNRMAANGIEEAKAPPIIG